MATEAEQEIAGWLNRIATGPDKEGAAKAIYLAHYQTVWSYLRSKCSDEQAVQEVTQDVFAAVFNKPEAFEGKSRFTTWLLGIANFKLADWQRGHMRHATRRADLDDDAMDALEDPDWDFVGRLEKDQLIELLRTCIDLLPAIYRDVIRDVALQELSEAEAAELFQCPRGTIKSRLSVARTKLQNCVAEGSGGLS